MRKPRDFLLYAGLGTTLGVGLMLLLLLGPRWLKTAPIESPAAPPASVEVRKIRARLFYVTSEGTALSGVEQEVMYSEGAVEQAKRLIEAQIAVPAAPLISAIPPQTKIRSVFLGTRGEAYIDLSGELRSNHPGGTTNEALTVYALVGALTANLPAITSVQILIDGKEVDTLAGHLDLRRPLEQDSRWVTNAN